MPQGLMVTLKHLFMKPVTLDYPRKKKPMSPRFMGRHYLERYDDGSERCVCCGLCAAACPANCIYIEAAENTEEGRISGGERYASVYNIDYSRCIFCGYCVEACPTDAITHGHDFEIASYNTSTLVYRKEQMLTPLPANFKPLVVEEQSSGGGH